MGFLLERDALNGKSGKAFMTYNGQNIELFGLKKFESNAEFDEADFKVVGTTRTQKKTTGVTMTGTATIYYGTPYFLRVLKEYLRTGKLPEITFQITNDDPSSSVGAQIVALYGVKLSKVPVAILNAEADFLEEEIEFSFTDFEPLSEFADAPAQLG